MDKHKRFFLTIGLCGLTVLLSAFFLTWFGIIDFRIVNEIRFDYTIECIFNIMMFMINMFFLFSISLYMFNKKIIWITGLYLPIFILLGFIENIPPIIFSTIIPCVYIIIIGIICDRRNIAKIIFRLGIITLSILFYQQISGYIKFSIFKLDYNICSTIYCIIYSIDLYLVYILLYCVVKKHAVVSGKLWIPSEADSVQESVESCEESLDTSDLTRRQRFIFWALAVGYQVFQLIVVLFIGFIHNVFVELLIMLAVFWLGRASLKKSWHSNKLWICSVVTFSGFYVLTKLTLPLSVSLFSCIALSALFVYGLHKAALLEERYESLKEFRDQRLAFNLKTCTREQLLTRCRECGFSAEDTKLAMLLFVDKIADKQAIEYFPMELQSMKNKKSKMRKALTNSTL